MLYTDDQKIITAKRLRNLRKNKKNPKGKSFSHKTLQQEIESKYPSGHVSDKSLMYYEITNKNNAKFHIGQGMKVETLVLLSDFYGVSCDYILGRDSYRTEAICESATEMGLDNQSRDILLYWMQHRIDFDCKKLISTLNSLIHSYSSKTLDNEQDSSQSANMTAPDYITQGFINILTRYLFFACDPQYPSRYSEAEDFGQLELSEDEVANLLLMDLQKYLQLSRDNHKPLRDAPENEFKRILSRGKRKQK